MATVTGLTADRMLAIEAASVVDGDVVGDNLILTKHDGTQINAGSVRGPAGPPGPSSSDLSVLAARPVLDIGLANQIRAGRQLAPSDFTNMGLAIPVGLWNLSDLADSSGNGRNLLNKGGVTFTSGINGVANTAANGAASSAQALYIADTGAADPFRIKTGSWGCWFRSAKRGAFQNIMCKNLANGSQCVFSSQINSGNVLASYFPLTAAGPSGTAGTDFVSVLSVSDVCDDRWHFFVVTFDGGMGRIYIDGLLENFVSISAFLFGGSGPLNIGCGGGDAATASINAFGGRIDEAFITTDILSEDQIRNLYCAKVTHTLGALPVRAFLNIRRRRKGASLVSADFPAQPARLYNFSAGGLGDEGSNNTAVTNSGASATTGADGSSTNAIHFAGAQYLAATDAGLPSGTNPRSFGCWFKTPIAASGNMNLIVWGQTNATNDDRLILSGNSQLTAFNGADSITGPFVGDGLWHFAVITEENAPVDARPRKLYLDGKLVGTSNTLVATVLGGGTSFRIGTNNAGAAGFAGQIDTVFVCSYVLSSEQIQALYAKGSQVLAPSPKNSGDHVEAMSATDLLVTFETLESQYMVDLGVA